MEGYPLLMKGPMIRAILNGDKTQTRRPMKPQPIHPANAWETEKIWIWDNRKLWWTSSRSIWLKYCPFGQVGDKLWFRETWAADPLYDKTKIHLLDRAGYLHYRATCPDESYFMWRPSIHMPRWACRLEAEITDVRVQHIKDITEDDSKAEGVIPTGYIKGRPWSMVNGVIERTEYRCTFRAVWDSIYGRTEYATEHNPWVWALSYKVI